MKEFDECLRSEWAKQRMREEAYEAQARERKRRRKLNRILFYILVAEILAAAVLVAAKLAAPQGEDMAPEGVMHIKEAPAAEAVRIISLNTVQCAAEEEEVTPKYYEVPLDHKTQDLLRRACEESGVTMELALAVIEQETDFRNVMGDGGDSTGYMQVQKKWHESRMERLGVTDLRDPAGNFLVGCDYLAELLAVYPKEEALTAYNRGTPGRSAYAKSVLAYEEANYERTC